MLFRSLTFAIGTGVSDRAGLRGPEVRGTMLPPPSGRRVDLVRLAAKGTQATGEAWTLGGGEIAVRLEMHAAGPFEAHVTFDPERYVPMSLRRIEPSGGRLDLRRGEVQVTDRGSGRFELRLKAVGQDRPPLSVWIGTAGGSAQGTLEPGPPG